METWHVCFWCIHCNHRCSLDFNLLLRLQSFQQRPLLILPEEVRRFGNVQITPRSSSKPAKYFLTWNEVIVLVWNQNWTLKIKRSHSSPATEYLQRPSLLQPHERTLEMRCQHLQTFAKSSSALAGHHESLCLYFKSYWFQGRISATFEWFFFSCDPSYCVVQISLKSFYVFNENRTTSYTHIETQRTTAGSSIAIEPDRIS